MTVSVRSLKELLSRGATTTDSSSHFSLLKTPQSYCSCLFVNINVCKLQSNVSALEDVYLNEETVH